MTTREKQSTLHSLRTVSAPVGCDPSVCVPRTDFNPLLKYSILIFVVCCTTRHISGGHAGLKQSTASTRNMGQPWTPTSFNQNSSLRSLHKIYCMMIRGTDHLVASKSVMKVGKVILLPSVYRETLTNMLKTITTPM